MNPVWPTDFYKFMWAYRGNPYQIVWKTAPNGRLTAEVTDLVLGLPVPYRRAPVSPSAPDSADGWCLYDTTSRVWQRRPTDTLTLGHTVSMAINGGLFDLQKNPAARDTGYPISQLPNPGDTWIVNPLPMAPAPILATYNIETQPMRFAPVSARMNVKAVPNPYLVRNEWERHRDFRKLKFINLPASCVIRIYTMSGDWVRTLRHEATDVSAGSLPNQQGGDEDWDLLTASGQKPAPGIYIFYVESAAGTQTGKFAIVY